MRYVSPKRRLNFHRLHVVISQNIRTILQRGLYVRKCATCSEILQRHEFLSRFDKILTFQFELIPPSAQQCLPTIEGLVDTNCFVILLYETLSSHGSVVC
jgi:hypothetical protein